MQVHVLASACSAPGKVYLFFIILPFRRRRRRRRLSPPLPLLLLCLAVLSIISRFLCVMLFVEVLIRWYLILFFKRIGDNWSEMEMDISLFEEIY